MTVSANHAMDAHLSSALLEGKDKTVDENGNGENDDRDHDDVIKDLNQTEEDVEEGDGSSDDVSVVEFDVFIGVGPTFYSSSEVFKPFRSICS